LGLLLLPVKFPWDLPANRNPHVPQCANGLGDLPLDVVGHEADLGMLAVAVVGCADLPLEVHQADLPLLVLGLLRQRDVW
jgi:hypothetical protein